MEITQFEQRQRQPDVIVEISLGSECWTIGFQYPGNHLPHCRLTIAAGHADHRYFELLSPVGGKLAERTGCISHDQCGQINLELAIRHHSDCTRAFRILGKILPIEMLSLQCDE